MSHIKPSYATTLIGKYRGNNAPTSRSTDSLSRETEVRAQGHILVRPDIQRKSAFRQKTNFIGRDSSRINESMNDPQRKEYEATTSRYFSGSTDKYVSVTDGATTDGIYKPVKGIANLVRKDSGRWAANTGETVLKHKIRTMISDKSSDPNRSESGIRKYSETLKLENNPYWVKLTQSSLNADNSKNSCHRVRKNTDPNQSTSEEKRSSDANEKLNYTPNKQDSTYNSVEPRNLESVYSSLEAVKNDSAYSSTNPRELNSRRTSSRREPYLQNFLSIPNKNSNNLQNDETFTNKIISRQQQSSLGKQDSASSIKKASTNRMSSGNIKFPKTNQISALSQSSIMFNHRLSKPENTLNPSADEINLKPLLISTLKRVVLLSMEAERLNALIKRYESTSIINSNVSSPIKVPRDSAEESQKVNESENYELLIKGLKETIRVLSMDTEKINKKYHILKEKFTDLATENGKLAEDIIKKNTTIKSLELQVVQHRNSLIIKFSNSDHLSS